ncbi:hypothetical protein DFAR_2450003 [Desulfarculales bacterium]
MRGNHAVLDLKAFREGMRGLLCLVSGRPRDMNEYIKGH